MTRPLASIVRRRVAAGSAAFRAASVGGDGQSATVNTLAVPVPAAAVAGDVAIVEFISSDTSETLATVPSGWTLRSGPDNASTSVRAHLFSKTLASGDLGTSPTWGTSGLNIRLVGHMQVYSGVTETGMQVAAPFIDTTNNTTTTIPSLASVPTGAMVHAAIMNRYFTTNFAEFADPAGYTAGANNRVASNYAAGNEVAGEVWYKVQSSAGAAGGETATTTANNSVSVNYLVALPAV